jgi:hypothetical protein
MKLDRKDSINFTLRMKAGLRLDLEKIALKESRNLTNLITMVLTKYVEEYNDKNAKK